MAQMPTVMAIRSELTSNLVVTTGVASRIGSAINVGETFKIAVQVWNDLLFINAAFTDVWVFVTGTQYATPTNPTVGNQVNVQLGTIPERSSQTTYIEFKALQRIPTTGSPDPLEQIATIRVRAQFAIQQLFTNFWQQQAFFQQIQPT